MQVQGIVADNSFSVVQWHEEMANSILADAILNRLVHIAQRIEFRGESIRRKLANLSAQETKSPRS